jgi:hypothetical protein
MLGAGGRMQKYRCTENPYRNFDNGPDKLDQHDGFCIHQQLIPEVRIRDADQRQRAFPPRSGDPKYGSTACVSALP